jgi:hypothetical protein
MRDNNRIRYIRYNDYVGVFIKRNAQIVKIVINTVLTMVYINFIECFIKTTVFIIINTLHPVECSMFYSYQALITIVNNV